MLAVRDAICVELRAFSAQPCFVQSEHSLRAEFQRISRDHTKCPEIVARKKKKNPSNCCVEMWSATKTEQNTGLAEYFGGQSQIHKSTDCSAKKTTRKHKCPKMFYF